MMSNSDTTTIVKVLPDGKIVKIENAAILAKLTTLLTANPASESSRELVHDNEFVKSCKAGIGEYHATRLVEKDGAKFQMQYTLKKGDTAKLFEQIAEIESALKVCWSFVSSKGDLPKRGRKSLDANYSEL